MATVVDRQELVRQGSEVLQSAAVSGEVGEAALLDRLRWSVAPRLVERLYREDLGRARAGE